MHEASLVYPNVPGLISLGFPGSHIRQSWIQVILRSARASDDAAAAIWQRFWGQTGSSILAELTITSDVTVTPSLL